MPPTPNLRQAVRAVILDPDDRVLLVRWRFPEHDVWGTPGGGIDAGEEPYDALRRELLEETGLDLHDPSVALTGCVAHRMHLFPMSSGHDGQEEHYYLVRAAAFEPRGRLNAEELRAENVEELRWWSVPELVRCLGDAPDAAEGPSRGSRRVVCAPRALPSLLAGWLAEGPPAQMVELAV